MKYSQPATAKVLRVIGLILILAGSMLALAVMGAGFTVSMRTGLPAGLAAAAVFVIFLLPALPILALALILERLTDIANEAAAIASFAASFAAGNLPLTGSAPSSNSRSVAAPAAPSLE